VGQHVPFPRSIYSFNVLLYDIGFLFNDLRCRQKQGRCDSQTVLQQERFDVTHLFERNSTIVVDSFKSADGIAHSEESKHLDTQQKSNQDRQDENEPGPDGQVFKHRRLVEKSSTPFYGCFNLQRSFIGNITPVAEVKKDSLFLDIDLIAWR
jgi:hypothetical protein